MHQAFSPRHPSENTPTRNYTLRSMRARGGRRPGFSRLSDGVSDVAEGARRPVGGDVIREKAGMIQNGVVAVSVPSSFDLVVGQAGIQ